MQCYATIIPKNTIPIPSIFSTALYNGNKNDYINGILNEKLIRYGISRDCHCSILIKLFSTSITNRSTVKTESLKNGMLLVFNAVLMFG